VKVDLTPQQAEALFSAAEAMLAGEEGEGDAQGVSFAVLERAQMRIAAKLTSRALAQAANKKEDD